MEQERNSTINIPDEALESFARCIFPAIRKFYESEDGQRMFEEWKAKQEA